MQPREEELAELRAEIQDLEEENWRLIEAVEALSKALQEQGVRCL